MNTNLKTSFLLMFAGIAICSCVNEADRADSDRATDNQIRVLPQLNTTGTRAGWNSVNLTQDGRQFGLFVHPELETPHPESTYDNVRMVYKNNAWNDYAPDDANATTPLRRMHWSNDHSNVRVTAYMPYRPQASLLTAITGQMGTEQNEYPQGESVAANDYLYFNGVINPGVAADKIDAYGNVVEYALVDGKIAIPFRHVASKLNLKIKIGTSFNITSSGTTTNPITHLKVNGTTCHYNFDLATGVMSKHTDEATSVSPWFDAGTYEPGETHIRKAIANYECILVPQTVAPRAFSVSLTIGGREYEWVSEAPVALMSGKQHTLTLNVGENIISLSDFTIDEWGTADIPVEPDMASPVEIDAQQSVIGEDVDLFVAEKRLRFTNYGGTATLVLTGDYDREYRIVNADPRLTIIPEDGEFKNASFKITATQIDEGEAFSTSIQVVNSLVETGKTTITIDVDANLIPRVEMGGLVWMAFNGVGRERSLYMHHSRKTVRDIYAQDWGKFTGMCMWGPRAKEVPMLYPWEVKRALNESGTTMNASTPDWTSENTNIPCPEGWRLPTYEEFAKIWPANGTSIPATYVRDNVIYTASIMPSGASAIPVEDNSPIETNLFVISDGKNELIFPMAGWRRRDDYGGRKPLMAVDAGKAFYLWTQNHGPQGWNVKVVGVNQNSTGYYNTGDSNQAMGEAYQSVRCVKIK